MIQKQKAEIRRFSLGAALFWTLAIALSFFWGVYHIKTSSNELALTQATRMLEKDLLYRRWAAMHGGIYVPVTEKTPPNPYLDDVAERDITTTTGRRLTLMNPAYMTRQVFELARESNYGIRGHITSLKPHRPGNEPDEWERAALLAFQQNGTNEVNSVAQLDGKPYLRYMKAFATEQSCLKCHARHGYKLGDIRGGISISIPLEPFIRQRDHEISTNAVGHGLIWLIGICFIQLVRSRFTASLLREESTEKALESSRLQLFQQEKMASIGQLAAGVAHEINNPMGFISSNLGTLGKYMERITEYQAVCDRVMEGSGAAGKDEVIAVRSRLKIDYVLNDAGQLISESLDGALRVKNIVDDLKSLSRSDKKELVRADINQCLESAVNISCNEIKYVADIDRQLGDVPRILCHPQQLCQVFINLLSNAGQAITGHGTITIRTWSERDSVFMSVADTGSGMPDEIRSHIFDPFFTTKAVGKGTGLGLSISYDIIRKHGGEITVDSKVGTGTTFTIRLPVDGMPQEQTDTLAMT